MRYMRKYIFPLDRMRLEPLLSNNFFPDFPFLSPGGKGGKTKNISKLWKFHGGHQYLERLAFQYCNIWKKEKSRHEENYFFFF